MFSSSYSSCHVVLVIMSVHNLLSHVLPIISDTYVSPCHDARLSASSRLVFFYTNFLVVMMPNCLASLLGLLHKLSCCHDAKPSSIFLLGLLLHQLSSCTCHDAKLSCCHYILQISPSSHDVPKQYCLSFSGQVTSSLCGATSLCELTSVKTSSLCFSYVI